MVTIPPHYHPADSLVTMIRQVLLLLALTTLSVAFVPDARHDQTTLWCSMTTTSTETTIDAKEAVKLFGRLAEKYIMLDESAGMCCYSACSDCEYRLPDGGYRMADQSAARPKWIPSYVRRSINGKEHVTQWSSQLFADTDGSLDEFTFCTRLAALDYLPTLGGPYLAASAASLDADAPVSVALFRALTAEKDEDADSATKDKPRTLSKSRLSIRWKQWAQGEEGLTWKQFAAALGVA